MDYAQIKRLSLKTFIGFLVLTALVAIISLLGGEFGELQVKILVTTFTISAASICSMSCAAFIERRKSARLGLSGIFLSAAGAILLIVGLWTEVNNDEYWKATVTLIVFAVAFAHAFLLALPELDDRQKWARIVSAGSIGLLALQIVAAVWGQIENDGYYRLLAVVAVVVALETLVIPILMLLRRGSGRRGTSLVLEKVEGERYKDPTGKMYHVREVPTEPADGAE